MIPTREEIEEMGKTDVIIARATAMCRADPKMTHEEAYRIMVKVMSLWIKKLVDLLEEHHEMYGPTPSEMLEAQQYAEAKEIVDKLMGIS